MDTLITTGIDNPKQSKKIEKHNAITSRIYGLCKTHSQNFQLRLVVCRINSPTYNITSLIHEHFLLLTSAFYFPVKNAFDFVNIGKTVTLPKDHILNSLVVISLFTNIPKRLVYDTPNTK